MVYQKANYWFDYLAVYKQLNKIRIAKKLSWEDLSDEIGVAPSTIRNLIKGGPMEADGIRAIVAWLNLPIESFIRCNNGLSIPKVAEQKKRAIQGKKVRFNKVAVYEELKRKKEALNMTWAEVAKEIGCVSPAMLTGLGKPGRISVDVLVVTTGWLGKNIESFTYYSEY